MGSKVRDWMRRDVRTVPEELSLAELDRRFLSEQVTGFPVTTREGRLVGVVSRSDVVRQLSTERTWAEMLSDYHQDWTGSEPPPEPSLEEIGERTGRRLEGRTVGEVMARDPVTVGPDDDLSVAAAVLVSKRIHRVPVIEGGRLVGILSSLDIARSLVENGG